MPSSQRSPESSVPQLLTAVKQLTPSELREFKRRFGEWQQQSSGQTGEEKALIQACKAQLSKTDESRLRILIGKSERGALRAK